MARKSVVEQPNFNSFVKQYLIDELLSFGYANEVRAGLRRQITEAPCQLIFMYYSDNFHRVTTSIKIDYISIKNTVIYNDTVFYDIYIKTATHFWCIIKRYSDFVQLNDDLRNSLLPDNTYKSSIRSGSGYENIQKLIPYMPAKQNKLLSDHLRTSFINKRRILLDNYLKQLINSKKFAYNTVFHNFLRIQNIDYKYISFDANNKINDYTYNEIDDPPNKLITKLRIKSTLILKMDHVLYLVSYNSSGTVFFKRFCEFYKLDRILRNQYSKQQNIIEQFPLLPEKRITGLVDHFDGKFIEKRRVLLEYYLVTMLNIPDIMNNKTFLNFMRVTNHHVES